MDRFCFDAFACTPTFKQSPNLRYCEAYELGLCPEGFRIASVLVSCIRPREGFTFLGRLPELSQRLVCLSICVALTISKVVRSLVYSASLVDEGESSTVETFLRLWVKTQKTKMSTIAFMLGLPIYVI